MKATAIAPSNVAFIKYWGRKNEELRLAENGSISMNLSNLLTTTTVEFDSALDKDFLNINGKEEENDRVSKHLDRIRVIAKFDTKARVNSKNNFPTGTGLSSSASGFAALTLAGTSAAGLDLSEKELSILARLGSGSACRSIPDGFVQWLNGDTSETSYGVSIFHPDYFEIADIVAVVSTEKKFLPTSEGQKSARTSPFFEGRLKKIENKINLVKKFIEEKDFTSFGELIETEALELHSILMTSKPPLIYWKFETISMMTHIWEMRKEGLEVYFTINTGHDVHVICKQKDSETVSNILSKLSFVKEVIVNKPSNGARIVDL